MVINLKGKGTLETYRVSPSEQAPLSYRIKLKPKAARRIMYLFPEQCLLEFVIDFHGIPVVGKGYFIPQSLEIQCSGSIYLQS